MQGRVNRFTTNNIVLPLLRYFMDDLSIISSTLSGDQILLSRCIAVLTLAGLEFRAGKSRSIVIFKVGSINTKPFFCFKSIRQIISFIFYFFHLSSPVKFLGRIIDGLFSDRKSSVELTESLLAGLSVIDKSHFTGTQTLDFTALTHS